MLQFFLNMCKFSAVPFMFLGIVLGAWWHLFMVGFYDGRELVLPSEPELDELSKQLMER